MSRTIGRSLELYYIDGRPDGMLTAEMFNWTGHVLMAPRTQIPAALAREEASYAGIYLLLGERNGEPLAYIGEGEDISARIRSHDLKKDWWTDAVLVTAAANKLNKAHVRFLEARLIEAARAVGRMPLDNSTSPLPPSLSEADVAKMEAFLENLFIVLPAVRVDMFIQKARREVPSQVVDAGTSAGSRGVAALPGGEITREGVPFTLHLPRKNFRADAVLNDRGEFVVLAGSQAREPRELGSYRRLYDEVLRAGVIATDADGQLRFSSDYAFASPSAAASVANGTSTNGPAHWKHRDSGESYQAWEARRVNPEAIAAEALRELGL